MVESSRSSGHVQGGLVWIAVVLLLGILILGWGYSADSRPGFYAGIFVILAGVLTGLQRILAAR